MEMTTKSVLDSFWSLQDEINQLYQFSEGDKYLIKPCQFFQMLTLPENNFKLIIPKGQKSKNINVKVIDQSVEFEETIDLENSLYAQIKIPYNKISADHKKIVEEILGAMSAIESSLNIFLSKEEKIDASKKYYLLFYNQSLEPPILGGNYLMARLTSPQMGLPFDFIFKDEVPDCLITLRITYKLSCRP